MRILVKRPLVPSLARTRRSRAVAALVLAGILAQPACTSVQRDSQSPSYLILRSLTAASGATPGQFGGTLSSDVLTYVKRTLNDEEVRVPTVFEDVALASFVVALRDPGTPTSPTQPSPSNFVTITRFRVDYVRADGRNTPGVDVPFGFDGAASATITDTGGSINFSLVRIQAKGEAPLQALVAGGGARAISAIAHITFYGTDQSGRTVSVSGQIGITFADWGDPD